MDKITKEQAEQAITDYRTAKSAKKVHEAIMAEAESIITAYANEHVTEFTDNKLALDSGMLEIKAGPAKAVTIEGKPMSTAARAELAKKLPFNFVNITIDASALYAADNKKVRQILTAAGVRIVKENKIIIS